MPNESVNWNTRLVSDRYEVHERIGDGGMAFVYRAFDKRLLIDVALKVPRQALLEQEGFEQRFRHEILSLVQLHHPHIVQVLDLGEDEGRPYAVMRYLKGGNLQSRRKRISKGVWEPKPPGTLLTWLPQIADALDFVHHREYVHRDVKPGNILFDEMGRPYLTDFGIIKAIGEKGLQQAQELTPVDMIFGTPAYLAPEACQGRPLDGRSDQYSLAVTVYEWLAGRQPIVGDTPLAVMSNQSLHTPSPLTEHVSDISPEISEVVARGLSKDPNDRYESCLAFANAVAAHVKPITEKLALVSDPTGRATYAPSSGDQQTTLPYTTDGPDPETDYQAAETHQVASEETDHTGGDEIETQPAAQPESVWSVVVVAIMLIALFATYVWRVNNPDGQRTDDPNSNQPPPKHATPDAAFASFQKAAVKQDWPALFVTLTDQSKCDFAGSMCVYGLAKELFDLQHEDHAKINDVFRNHGLDKPPKSKAVKLTFSETRKLQAFDREFWIIADKRGKVIAKKATFTLEMVTAVDADTSVKMSTHAASAKLSDLNVQGPTATATIVTTPYRAETLWPIRFSKHHGSWQVDLTPLLQKLWKVEE